MKLWPTGMLLLLHHQTTSIFQHLGSICPFSKNTRVSKLMTHSAMTGCIKVPQDSAAVTEA